MHTLGRATHISKKEQGVDAIAMHDAGHRRARRDALHATRTIPTCPGCRGMNVGSIIGGRGRDHNLRGAYTVSDFCTAYVNVRFNASQSARHGGGRHPAHARRPGRRATRSSAYEIEFPPALERGLGRLAKAAVDVPKTEPVVQMVRRNLQLMTGPSPEHFGVRLPQSYAGNDTTHLWAAGIPCCLYGPGGGYTDYHDVHVDLEDLFRLRAGARAHRARSGGMTYVDPSTGRTYPLSGGALARRRRPLPEPRPRRPGSAAGDIDTARHSVWRYAKALLVGAEHAVIARARAGRRWCPGEWNGAPRPLQARVHDAHRLLQGPRHDRDGLAISRAAASRACSRTPRAMRARRSSAYAAAAGLACRILVPETASYPKIAQIAACGADVVTVKGSRQDVAEAALRQSAEIFYASHNWQPFFVEGTKTLAYELWEQLGFRAPDNRRGAARLRQQCAGRRARLRRARPPGRDRQGPAALRRAGGELRALRTPRSRRASSTWCRPRSRPRWRRASPPPSPPAWRRCCARCAASGGAVVAVERGGDRGGAPRSRPPRALRGAHLRHRRRRAQPPARRRRHPPATSSTVLVLTGSGLKASATTGELLKLHARAE